MLDQSPLRAGGVIDDISDASEDPTSTRPATSDETSLPAVSRIRGAHKGAFHGTERFVIERRLGSGGFGVVYQARDLAKGTTVALKSLQHVTPESLYRFKREFRSLADVSHPNLVQLYELGSNADDWFFTMELVKGSHFLDHVCGDTLAPPHRRPLRESNAETKADADRGPRGSAAATPAPMTLASTPASLERLIPAMRQLVRGLDALHRSGHVHRDVKPPNVLVTPEGRVVVLDFGLVMDLEHDATLHSMQIAGTPMYMSPEQAAALPLTPASDFYSVGVMLYEALTGTAPFRGTFLQIVSDKQRLEPPPPGTLVKGIPPELDALCRDLMRRAAADRPSADEVLDRLDRQPHGTSASGSRGARSRERRQPFVGRRQQIDALTGAADQMIAGTPTVAAVFGPSGIGKSVLVKTFLDGIRDAHPETVILTGRCYERESVPYKALDSLIDALARHLKRLPAHDMRALLPRETAALAQLFPVLRQFHECLPQRSASPPDLREVRRRAYAALRELLARIGDRHPLVLFIDDLQWGDVDSAALLSDVMRLPDAPVLLLLLAYRDAETHTSPFLRTFLKGDVPSSRSFVSVPVDRLTTAESRELAAALLETRVPSTTEMAAAIAAEAGGSPFFIDELVRSTEAAGTLGSTAAGAGRRGDTDARDATLAHMIQLRLSRLPVEAQRLLQLVAVNGRPIPENVLKSAAYAVQPEPLLALLRSEHLLRARETDRGIELEAYHDRIRETVVGSLAVDALRDAHHRLATAFESHKSADAELLAEHLLAAQQPARARHYTLAAAREAEQALAFDRAARLYRRCLELLEPASSERGAVMVSLAKALTNAGRGAEAAAVYLEAPASSSLQALDFKQMAAQQLLFGGHVDRGVRVIRDVLGSIGMTLPETRRQTIAALIAGRVRVRLRGLRYRPREASAIAPSELMQVDACWSVSAGLGVVDTIRGAVFQTRHLDLALRAGEIERVHRALCLEAAFSATAGSRRRTRTQRIVSMTRALARRIDTPYAHGIHGLCSEGLPNYLEGQWGASLAAITEAERLFTDACTGVTWELDCARFFGLLSRFYIGRFKEIADRYPVLVKDALERGDLYASTMLGGHLSHIVFLAADDPSSARRHTADAMAQWSQRGFHVQHLGELWSVAQIALYEGKGAEAWSRIMKMWPVLRTSLLLQVQVPRVNMLYLRARRARRRAASVRSIRARAIPGGRQPLRAGARRVPRRMGERPRVVDPGRHRRVSGPARRGAARAREGGSRSAPGRHAAARRGRAATAR